MAAGLPVPIEFRLPEGWRTADPDDIGAPGVAFVALHPHPDDGFAANITIDGDFMPATRTLLELAEESEQRLRGASETLAVLTRRETGSPRAPGLSQRLEFTAVAGGARRKLAQTQVYLGVVDATDPAKRAHIRLTLTSTAAQHDVVLDDFQQFVSTVAPDTAPKS
ncbi:hypothetical protein SRB5_16540 [Streptomyces sp. RB5]|uniref:DUF1795 domain-containing protein n=1 Tax=Streptomyces smaragdinus TaxID=2585196 RepID=A0A7K0CDI6_9ACTN|nr:hypothetical protein [Streptomyces smaragdinus]MQY11535.1 hypothetical protein [Streptomyces smaragdinus]